MELRQLKNILWQTEFGKFFEEGMVCSELIPKKITDGMDEHCFWYRYDLEGNIFSGPVVRISYNADRKEGLDFIPCDAEPFFSMGPNEVVTATRTSEERSEKYPKFEEMYNLARPIFYKENCAEEEKQLLSEFYKSFKDYEDESLMVFYRELVPDFFDWLKRQIGID